MVNGIVCVEMMNMRSKNLIIIIIFISLISALCVDSNNSVHESKRNSYVGARADCPTVAGADTLTLTPPGPFVLPAHQTVIFQSSIKDSSDAGINADPLWGVTNGTIVPSNGFEQATFIPHSTGDVTVWACVDGINTTASVTVVQGEVNQLILESNVTNLSADYTATFILTQVDIRGNSAPANPPLTNWTLPVGSDLDLGSLVWTPDKVGHHFISVNYNGMIANTELNVSHGIGLTANIVSPTSTLTSDENVAIFVELNDMRGNTWIVEGDWSLTDPEASQSWLDINGTDVTFNANTTGNWIIQAIYDGMDSEDTLTDFHTFTVTPGVLFEIVIEGNGVTMTVDDELDLDPKMFDYDMNELTGIPIIWEVNGDIKTIDLESTNFVFSTEYLGQYEIQASAGDKYASILFDVTYGNPITLQITGEESSAIVVRSGDDALVYAEAVDQYGNAFPVDVEWSYAEYSGSFDPNSKGNGWYLYKPGELQGFILFNATYENIYHEFIIDVQQGSASQLLISFSGDLVVGNSVEVTVYAIDSAGSKIAECDSSSITGDLSSTAGTFSMEENVLHLNIEESGQQHSITITCLGMEETTFFDVQSSLFGGVFGSSNSAILILSLVVMCVIALLLFVIMRRSRERYYGEEDDEEDEPTPLVAPPAIAFSQTTLPLPTPQVSPVVPQALPLPSITPPPLPNPPLPPPTPLSSIGQGLVAPPMLGDPPQTAEGVWIQPQTDYGWNEQQSPMFVNEPALGGYGWEGNTQSLPLAPPKPENKLSNALSSLGPMTSVDEITETTASDNEFSSNNVGLESEVEHPESISSDDTIIKPIKQASNENNDSEQILETIDGDSDEGGWGAWDTDNWGSQDWKDKAKERAIEEAKKDDYDRGETKHSTMPVFEHVIGGRDMIGPLDDFGKVMSPLPGTNVGTSGWYLGSDGSPSQWEFRPRGWKKIQ